MTKQQVICDRCGAEKKGMNCWWSVYEAPVAEHALVIQPSGYKPVGDGGWVIIPADFCSQACAMRAIDEWMSARITESKAKEKQAQEVAEAAEEMGGGVRR